MSALISALITSSILVLPSNLWHILSSAFYVLVFTAVIIFSKELVTHTFYQISNLYVLPVILSLSLFMPIGYGVAILILCLVAYKIIIYIRALLLEIVEKPQNSSLYISMNIMGVIAGICFSYLLISVHFSTTILILLLTCMSVVTNIWGHYYSYSNKLERFTTPKQILVFSLFTIVLMRVIGIVVAYYGGNAIALVYLLVYAAFITNVLNNTYEDNWEYIYLLLLFPVVAFLSPIVGILSKTSFFMYSEFIGAPEYVAFISSAVNAFLLTRHRELFSERTPFGMVEVNQNWLTGSRYLELDGIIQSVQDPGEKYNIGYYVKRGPVEQFFGYLREHVKNAKIGIVGLGAGCAAKYLSEDQTLKFFEINPVIVEIAQDPLYFSFIEKSLGKVDIVTGDARKTMTLEPDHYYDGLLLDGYLDSNVPRVLLTFEAIQLYISKLKPNGVLLIHATTDRTTKSMLHKTLEKIGLPTLYSKSDTQIDNESLIDNKLWQNLIINRSHKFIKGIMSLLGVKTYSDDSKFSSYWVITSKNKNVLENFSKALGWDKIVIDRNDNATVLYDHTLKFIENGDKK